MKEFSILLGTIGIGFGCCLHANLTHGEESSTKVKAVLNLAFWPLFGEIDSVLEGMDERSCKEGNQPDCLGSISYVATYLLLMLYMILGTLLLINLLIAIFRYKSIKIILKFYKHFISY